MTPGHRSYSNAIAYRDIRATTKSRDPEECGLLVQLFPDAAEDHGALLGEAFVLLRGLDVGSLRRAVSGLRRGRMPDHGGGGGSRSA